MARSSVYLRESSIDRLGRILSQKWNIKVVFGAQVPHTTGKVIYLPPIPRNASPDFLQCIQGHLDHETSHVLFTDFDAIDKIKNEDKKFYLLVNAIEDSRIEREYVEVWPGARRNLAVSLEWALKKMAEPRLVPNSTVTTDNWKELSQIGKLLYVTTVFPQINFDVNHWFIRDVVDVDSLRGVFSVEELLKEAIVSGGNTQKVIDIARKIMEIWTKDNKEQPKLPAPEGAKKELKSDQITPEPAPDTPHQEEPVIPSNIQVTSAEVEKYNKLTSKQEFIVAEIDKQNQVNPPKYAIYTTEGDRIEKMTEGDRSLYNQFMSDSVQMTHVIKKRLARSLLSTKNNFWETGKARGQLDSRSSFRVALGTSNRVFKARVLGEDYNTAVMLMVDHSGSMCNGKLSLATQTALIFGEVLNSIGIPFSVVGFSTGDPTVGHQRQITARKQDLTLYTRWGDLWLGVYKDFGDMWSAAGPRVAKMVSQARVNTYDGESLCWGAKQLLQRPEKRKIMFWLNDGQPSPTMYDSMPAAIQHTYACAKEVESLVELIAVGINSVDVKKYYQNCMIVGNIQELPKLCLTELDALLRKGKKLNGEQRRR